MFKENKLNNVFDANSINESGSSAINISSKPISKYTIFISKHIKILVFIEIVLVFVIGYMFLIQPKLSELSASNKMLKDKNLELQKIQEYLVTSKNLNEDYQKIKTDNERQLEKLLIILPNDKELPELFAQIEALAIKQNLIVGNISVNSSSNISSSEKKNQNTEQATKNSDLIREIEVSVSILSDDGSYDKVKKFLDAMETHIRLIDITSFSFDEKMTSYSIVFKTYFLKSNESKS
ncbi:MAG TPA: hypothetical protein PLD95_01460 [bacterium]|jgi:Tfp pilus assembly protein PilO|nr:hypothetical protein [bacterium]HOG38115.1 hypothetical protein [bacterium]HQI03171.1 hypothetical protein [bacterium]